MVGSVAIPVYWAQLEKLGVSSQGERKAMFEEAMLLFDLKGMTLLADMKRKLTLPGGSFING